MLIIGCGDIGARMADLATAAGTSVRAFVRSTTSYQRLLARGLNVAQCDLDSVVSELPWHTAGGELVYLAPPPAYGNEDLRMQHFLAALAGSGQPRRILYLSTTGVYGDCGGAWVDETAPARPQVARARRRWDAEQQLRAWRSTTGNELVIVRVAGIYGPGKLPLARLRRGDPMICASDAPWTNRIHSADLARVCLAALTHGRDGEIYNATDGQPGNMSDYFNRVADRAGLPRPPLIDLASAGSRLSPGLLSYLAESRRISNHKMCAELGVQLMYPDLESGLAACDLDRSDTAG